MTRPVALNPERASRLIAFIQMLPIVDGPAVGTNFTVDPWLESWLRAIYEPEYDDGIRVVRRAGLSAARKNCKSYVVAGLVLANLVGPEAVPNGQVYSCAVDREQAAVIFHMCRKMIEMRPALQKYLKVVASTKTIYVTRSDIKGRGSVYRALSAESSTKHGLGPSFFVYDELGEARNDELLNTMLDGQQAVASPLAVAISTQNPDPTHAFSQWMTYGLTGTDPTAVAHLHAADDGCDLMDRDQWIKANPCLLSWKKFDAIETAAREAVTNPSKESNFRRRYLNQRIDKNASLISRADWESCARDTFEFEDGEEIYLGLDMSVRTDLTALVAVSAKDGSRIKSWFWKPADMVDEHAKRDRTRYDLFVQQGWLLTSPGRSIAPAAIAYKIAELVGKYEVLGIAYDRYRTEDLLGYMDDIGLSAVPVEPWGQGYKDMGPAVDALEHAVLIGELTHDSNPLLTFCMMNAQVIMDPAGNRKLDKEASRFRIDGAVACAMALGLKSRARETPQYTSPFEDPEYTIKCY